MSEPLRFGLTVDQNPYLPAGGDQIHAVLTVTATDPAPEDRPTTAPPRSEVIIIDNSTSMSGGKIAAARQAATAAVATLPDGARFAVLAGSDGVRQVYPHWARLTQANPRTRAEAAEAIGRIAVDGGTKIGVWLRGAAKLLKPERRAVRHAILLTDGQNGQPSGTFEADLAYCAGGFRCDCLGVGEDWQPDELAKIAQALSGTRDYVPDPADLAGYFAALTRQAMARSVPELWLRVQVPQLARVISLKQVFPTVRDLTAGTGAGDRAGDGPAVADFLTGSWAAEERAYHLQVGIPAGEPGAEIRAAAVRLVLPPTGAELARGNVLAVWTDDLRQATQANPKVAHYTGQVALGEQVQAGLQALDAGDLATATARLGEARRLAGAAGHAETARLLDRLVAVDPRTGTAKLRGRVARSDRLALDVGTDKTVKLAPAAPGTGPEDQP